MELSFERKIPSDELSAGKNNMAPTTTRTSTPANTTTQRMTTPRMGLMETITIFSDCLPRSPRSAAAPDALSEEFIVLDACNSPFTSDGQNSDRMLDDENETVGLGRGESGQSWDEADEIFGEHDGSLSVDSAEIDSFFAQGPAIVQKDENNGDKNNVQSVIELSRSSTSSSSSIPLLPSETSSAMPINLSKHCFRQTPSPAAAAAAATPSANVFSQQNRAILERLSASESDKSSQSPQLLHSSKTSRPSVPNSLQPAIVILEQKNPASMLEDISSSEKSPLSKERPFKRFKVSNDDDDMILGNSDDDDDCSTVPFDENDDDRLLNSDDDDDQNDPYKMHVQILHRGRPSPITPIGSSTDTCSSNHHVEQTSVGRELSLKCNEPSIVNTAELGQFSADSACRPSWPNSPGGEQSAGCSAKLDLSLDHAGLNCNLQNDDAGLVPSAAFTYRQATVTFKPIARKISSLDSGYLTTSPLYYRTSPYPPTSLDFTPTSLNYASTSGNPSGTPLPVSSGHPRYTPTSPHSTYSPSSPDFTPTSTQNTYSPTSPGYLASSTVTSPPHLPCQTNPNFVAYSPSCPPYSRPLKPKSLKSKSRLLSDDISVTINGAVASTNNTKTARIVTDNLNTSPSFDFSSTRMQKPETVICDDVGNAESSSASHVQSAKSLIDCEPRHGQKYVDVGVGLDDNDADAHDDNDEHLNQWELMSKLNTDDERYRTVRQLWRNLDIPDLSRNLSCQNYRRGRRPGSVEDNVEDAHFVGGSKSRKRQLTDRLGPNPAAKRPRHSLDWSEPGTVPVRCTSLCEFRCSQKRMTYEVDLNALQVERKNALEEMKARHRREGLNHLRRCRARGGNIGDMERRHEQEIGRADVVYANRARFLEDRFYQEVAKMVELRDEILMTRKFYCGLSNSNGNLHADGDYDLLDDEQIREIEDTDRMYTMYTHLYACTGNSEQKQAAATAASSGLLPALMQFDARHQDFQEYN